MAKRPKTGRSKTPRQRAPGVPTIEANGGLLWVGNPGNSGGLGRPPELIRQHCRGSFAERIHILEEIADGRIMQQVPTRDGIIELVPPVETRIRAIDALGRYGGIEKLTLEPPANPDGTVKNLDTMNRVMAMIGRALLAAPAAQRLAVLQEIERAEVLSEVPES